MLNCYFNINTMWWIDKEMQCWKYFSKMYFFYCVYFTWYRNIYIYNIYNIYIYIYIYIYNIYIERERETETEREWERENY